MSSRLSETFSNRCRQRKASKGSSQGLCILDTRTETLLSNNDGKAPERVFTPKALMVWSEL